MTVYTVVRYEQVVFVLVLTRDPRVFSCKSVSVSKAYIRICNISLKSNTDVAQFWRKLNERDVHIFIT